MKRMRLISGLAIAILAAASPAISRPFTYSKAASLKFMRSLQKQGFSEGVDAGGSVKYLGSIPARGGFSYLIYEYYHEEIDRPDGHAFESIIIRTSRGKYIGLCDIDTDTRNRVHGRDVIIVDPPYEHRIHFDWNGPVGCYTRYDRLSK